MTFSRMTLLSALALAAALAPAQGYQRPSQAILDVLNAPPTPSVSLSPTRDTMLLSQGASYPEIEELAAPILRIAGLRLDPATSGPQSMGRVLGMTLKDIATGRETRVDIPRTGRLSGIRWSPNGRSLALTNTLANRIELWIVDTRTGRSRAVRNVTLNAAYGNSVQWMPDSRTLLVQLVPSGRGPIPTAPRAPTGPEIQTNQGRPAPVRTYQDLLQTAHDETLFEYFATSQLATVDAASGRTQTIGRPAMFDRATPSPDGSRLLVTRTVRPFSRLLPASGFPSETELWTLRGGDVQRLHVAPSEEGLPMFGVPTGPRGYAWKPTDPATLTWVEALDEGDPKKKVPFRDRIMIWSVGSAPPREMLRLEHRFSGMSWGEDGQMGIVLEYDRDRQRRRAWILDASREDATVKPLYDLNVNDRYGNPGTPVTKSLPNGRSAIVREGEFIYLEGAGASAEGDRPFLDRVSLRTLEKTRLFQSEKGRYETVSEMLEDDASRLLIRSESAIEPPNYYVLEGNGRRAVTTFKDPTPQIRNIYRERVTYKRSDGVECSFTLYLPPGRKPGDGPLPTVVWAYPLEYTDPATAGQISGSLDRFTTIRGTSQLFLLMAGYAVLNDVTMPIVGDPETVNNTFVEQLVDSARAAIDKAASMGVADPKRVGVMGHSYGAFMTANLLAHSDLFRAGVARSGAYNRTLTPFGFQSERRTLWEAPEMYLKVSPFMVANKINEPILLIHGVADNNSGTFPMQSERLFQAIKGNGGTVRLVMLPHESHGYGARQSIEHVIWETINWLDTYVKGR